MFSRTALDLNGDVAQSLDAGEPGLIDGGRLGPIRNQRHHGSVMAGSDTPKVEVRNPITAFGFEAVSDLACNSILGFHVKQHDSRSAD